MNTIKIYEELLNLISQKAKSIGISDKELEKYYKPEIEYFKSQNYFCRLASSLQNSGMMHNSIKFNEDSERFETIRKVLFDFDEKKVIKEYKAWTDIYNAFINNGIVDNGKERKKETTDSNNKETNWEKYSKGLYDGAIFLTSQKGELMNDVLKHNNCEFLDKKAITQINKIKDSIHGLGFALTCDWLKECGCTWLAKPDVHINKVYNALNGYDIDDIVKEKEVITYMFNWTQELKPLHPEITAYKLDKIIWLICTGNFYLDKEKVINRNTIINMIEKYK